MSDFGVGACDFHSDFRTEGNDYASDFRDFPGDFGGEPRMAKQPPETTDTETAPPEQGTAAGKAKREQGRRQTGSASGKPRSRVQRHAIRP